MKNKGILILIFSLVIIIIVLVTVDFSSTRINNRPDNPYEFQVEEYKQVPEELIRYKETRQFRMDANTFGGLSYHDELLYVIADQSIRIINPMGRQLGQFSLADSARCIHVVNKEFIITGHQNYISIYNNKGELLVRSEKLKGSALITSVAGNENKIYAADAGNRNVVIFDEAGNKTSEFEGVSKSSVLHGFIIPSPYFDIAVNKNHELWVVNPGMHALQQYSDEGNLENFWEKASMKIEGFSGCCNPAHFTFLPNGHFITSEKGMVRIKEYDEKGTLLSVVAAPQKFKEEGKAPEVVADEQGNVIALDYDKKVIRFFEHE